MRIGPNRCGDYSRNWLENKYKRCVSMVSIIPNGSVMAITGSASTVESADRWGAPGGHMLPFLEI